MDLFIRIFTVSLVPGTAFVTFLLSKRHREQVEERDGMSGAITALTDANKTFTAMVAGQLAPFQKQIDEAAKKQAITDQRLANNEAILQEHERVIAALVLYTKRLRKQLIDRGIDPVAPPPELSDHFGDFQSQPTSRRN